MSHVIRKEKVSSTHQSKDGDFKTHHITWNMLHSMATASKKQWLRGRTWCAL